MSVGTGIPPAALLELDAAMFDALLVELGRRWTTELELSAQRLELAHAHFLAFLRVHTRKGTTLPPALEVPRPRQADELERRLRPTVPRLSIGEFAKLTGADVTAPGGG